MTVADAVYLVPCFAWTCPSCRRPSVDAAVPVAEDELPAGLVRRLKRDWGGRVPADKAVTHPTEVYCLACGASHKAHRGELSD